MSKVLKLSGFTMERLDPPGVLRPVLPIHKHEDVLAHNFSP